MFPERNPQPHLREMFCLQSHSLNLQFFRQRGGMWRHKQLHPLAFSSPPPPSTYHTISLSVSVSQSSALDQTLCPLWWLDVSVCHRDAQRDTRGTNTHANTPKSQSGILTDTLSKVTCQSDLTTMIKTFRFISTQEFNARLMLWNGIMSCKTAKMLSNA